MEASCQWENDSSGLQCCPITVASFMINYWAYSTQFYSFYHNKWCIKTVNVNLKLSPSTLDLPWWETPSKVTCLWAEVGVFDWMRKDVWKRRATWVRQLKQALKQAAVMYIYIWLEYIVRPVRLRVTFILKRTCGCRFGVFYVSCATWANCFSFVWLQFPPSRLEASQTWAVISQRFHILSRHISSLSVYLLQRLKALVASENTWTVHLTRLCFIHHLSRLSWSDEDMKFLHVLNCNISNESHCHWSIIIFNKLKSHKVELLKWRWDAF